MSAVITSQQIEPMISERRQHIRYDIQVNAQIRLKNKICYEGTTLNISNGGAFFKMSNVDIVSEEAPCILTLLPDDENSDTEVKIKCLIKPSRHGGAALQFNKLLSDEYIQSLLNQSQLDLGDNI